MSRCIDQNRIAVILAAIAVVAGLALPSVAQDAPLELDQFRILLYSGHHLEGSNGLLTETEFTGTNGDGDEIHLSRDEIKILDVAGASKTGQFASMGALVGLSTAGLAVLQVQADPYSEVDTAKLVPVTAALVGVGALVGAMIGSDAREWETMPLTPAVGLSPDRTGLRYAVSVSF